MLRPHLKEYLDIEGHSSRFIFCYLPPSWTFNHSSSISINLGFACFVEILQNCVVRQVFGRMCSIVLLAFTLKLPIQNLLSVAPTQSVFWLATQFQQNEHIPEFFSILLFKFNTSMSWGSTVILLSHIVQIGLVL